MISCAPVGGGEICLELSAGDPEGVGYCMDDDCNKRMFSFSVKVCTDIM